DLRAVPLETRRAVLQSLLGTRPSPSVRMSEVFDASAGSVFTSACRLGLEGVIAKRRDSTYRSSRGSDWIKLKCSQRQEFVVAGFTDPQGARAGFGALLLGVYDKQGQLQHAGKVGSGFSESALLDIRQKLAGSLRKTSPFARPAKVEGRPHWVEPVWVAEVSFGEWTQAGHIRHAVFRGLRSDKEPTLIVREKPRQPAAAQPTPQRRSAAAPTQLAGMRVTHPDRVIDASTGTTKLDLLRYYALVGPLMMKHLKDRPVSLVRAPAGVEGHLFFQKHAETDKLPGVRQLDPALSVGHPPLVTVANAKGLLSAAQWNVIEFHTMNSGTAPPAHPNRLVFDLDPGAGVAWAQVQEAAQLTRSFLETLGLPAFLKTSGGKGLHVVVPIRKGHDWDTVKGFSQAIVQHMAKTIPQRFVAKSGPKNRIGKIFIDYLRNGQGATTVCAWSARARPGLGISVPLAWKELDALRGGDHWRVKTAQQRLDTGNEPWAGYARAARGLDAAMRLLGYTAQKK
ncbi:MAG: DNA ligase D, partial [Rubrivivax sp.]|nr:DNA ligase D [Rubrivivax sp.]